MTTPEDVKIQESDSPSEEESYYVVDPAKAKELDRSLEVLLLTRRCPSCKARLESTGETPSLEAQIKDIAKNCAHHEGYIRPEMPMQEIVFRCILAERNQPMSLNHLHHLVTDEWYTPANPRNLSVAGLKLVLDHDQYYGFQEVEMPSGAE